MNRSPNNSVTINMDARESSALDKANNITSSYYNKGIIETGRSTNAKNINKTYKNDITAVHHPSNSLQGDKNNLAGVKNNMHIDNNIQIDSSQGTQHIDKFQSRTNAQQNLTNSDQFSSKRHEAEDLKQQFDDSGRPSTLSQPGATRSRPGSVTKNIPFKERPSSSLSVPGRSPRPNSSKNYGRHSLRMSHASNGDEDDEELSMEGLSELLGTVRQYAQEIREIYAPIKKDEEERIRKKEKRNARRKSKDMNKRPDKQTTSPIPHEVRVEIHKTYDQIHEHMLEEGRRSLRHEILSHSQSQEPSPGSHIASLHVEEEQLPNTWPRGQQRPRSRERFSSDSTSNKQNPYTSSSPTYMKRPQISADWCAASSVQHEKEMLNKAFQRIQKPSDDPLIGTFIKSRSRSQIHEQMMNSRQGVIEVAKQHKQARQAALPSISVISPATEYRNKSWNSTGGILPSAPPEYGNEQFDPEPSAPPLENEPYNRIIPKADDNYFRGNAVHHSAERASDTKSRTKDGLRRRKSVDQELGQEYPVLKKY